MLERLYAALSSGPALNCRPHNSRQRFDLSHIQRLNGVAAHQILADVLNGSSVTVKATHAQPGGTRPTKEEMSGDVKEAWEAWDLQSEVLAKLKVIAEDGRAYEQDTGAQVLYIGYPIVQLPPSTSTSTGRTKKRVIAPVSFIPVSLTVKSGRSQSVVISAIGEGRNKVIANAALFAWLEQQTGTKFSDIDPDEHGENCWNEINDLSAAVATALQIPALECTPENALEGIPKTDEEDSSTARVLSSAIIGLFPMSNLGLIRDTEAMIDGEPLEGTIPNFIRLDATVLDGVGVQERAQGHETSTATEVKEEYLVSNADPCQARAVRLARKSKALVVHGPPGTGKSQTITNMIGDHLARGDRVLFVCDKRTALDVVLHRLDHLGLGSLCAVVYDAQRDQRDLYMGVREQLEELADKAVNNQAISQLDSVTSELKKVHAEMSAVFKSLAFPREGDSRSFHEMVGRWMEIDAQGHDRHLDLSGTGCAEITSRTRDLKLALDRAASVQFGTNPWRDAVAVELGAFLATPVETWRSRFSAVTNTAQEIEKCGSHLPLSHDVSFRDQAQNLRALAADSASSLRAIPQETISFWAAKQSHEVSAALATFNALNKQRALLGSGSTDHELALTLPAAGLADVDLNVWLAKLAAYNATAKRWYAFLSFKKKNQASEILARVGLELSAENSL
jgi:hypothetical protein